MVDALLGGRAAPPAPFLGPGDAGESRRIFLRLPRLGARDRAGRALAGAVALGGAGPAALGMSVKEGANLGAELGFLRRVPQIHWSLAMFKRQGERAAQPPAGSLLVMGREAGPSLAPGS